MNYCLELGFAQLHCRSDDTIYFIVYTVELFGFGPYKAIHAFSSQMPDADLENRRILQKVDPITGAIYTKDVYDPAKPEPKQKV
jgi:hypothetical protein